VTSPSRRWSTAPGGSWRERVLREARAAAALDHRHIAAIYDVGEENGAPYLVMELVSGPDLAASPPTTIDEAIAIAIQVCDALAHAHGRGIVHRDLKPANILRAAGAAPPEVKLVDLGIALVNGHDRLTATGQLLGTPSYLAPEQAQGATADARSDLYALGAMLYEWIVGEPPFVAGDAMAVIAQHVHAEPAPPSTRRPQLPAALETLILRLLAKDPAARPGSAGEVRDELAGLLTRA
jgi:serine/threonine-protein kinase